LLDQIEAIEGRMLGSDRSTDAPVSEEGDGERQDIVSDERKPPETSAIAANEDGVRRQWLRVAVERLSQREGQIARR
jgi:RNA polymerase sigma-32 factor